MMVNSKKHAGGYSLVEVAVVLAVIGLMIGGVSIAKEVVREAEYKRLYSKWLAPWKQVYDLYYTRTGVVLGDSQIAPTLMANGFEARLDNANGALAGIPENYDNTGLRICHGQGYRQNSVGSGDPQLAVQDLHELFDRVGVRMPAGRAEGYEDRYVYNDSNGNAVELQVCFQWNRASTISGAGNVMVLRGLTPDLARKLDQLIDGKPDALEGRFRQQDARFNSAGTLANKPGYEWGANNTYGWKQTLTPTARGEGNRRDEDQVVLVSAHWLMDQ